MKKRYLILLLFFFGILASYSQNTTVKGKVSDVSGLPLPGANVSLKGTKSAVATDIDGNYQIEASKGATLIFSYIGFSNQEIKVTGSSLNVVLKENGENKLEEVVVTAMGIRNKTKSLGYANQTIKAADVERPGQLNALESLQGSVSGITISKTSGEAGGGVDILIRGVSSLSTGSNNQPLIIIDGNPVNNSTISGNVLASIGNSPSSAEQFSFSNRGVDLNPNDIESYTVLKGAGATALYGILAGNGVIIITTKKGKEGKTKVNVSSSTSFNDVNKYPELQSTYREGSYRRISPTNTTLFDYYPAVKSMQANTPSGIEFYTDPRYTDGRIINGGFQSNGPKYSSADGPGIYFRNFYKDFFKTGVNFTNNVSLSGGTDKINYFVSASTSKDQGIVPNTDYTRKTFKFNGGYKLSENLKLGTSVTYSNSGGARANGGDRSIMSVLSYWSPSIDVNDYLTPSGSEKDWSVGTVDQPLYLAMVSNLHDKVDRWIASADLNWQAKPWLQVVYRASLDNYAEQRNRYVGSELDAGGPVGGFIVNENINFKGLNSNFMVTANKKFGDFNTSVLVGNMIFDTNSNYMNVIGEGLLKPNFNNMANTTKSFPPLQTNEIVRTVGYYTELKADYKERIFVSATGRRDYASTLPKANRAFNYFSANLAFVFHDLIDKEGNILSYGKLRGSWAQVGKVPPFGIGRYSSPDTPFNGVGGVSIGTVDADPNIKAEIVTTNEAGIDLNFVHNRIRLEYTYFDRTSDGQILKVTVPQSAGLSSIWKNSGSLNTKGHELTLAADILKSNAFKWTATVNFTAYKTEVLSLPFEQIDFANDAGASEVYSRIKVGDAIGSLYAQSWTYVNGQRLIVNGLPVMAKDANGAIAYTNVGNAFPDYVVTLNNSLKYKNWNLGFLVEYKKGGEVFDSAERNGIRNGNLKMTEDRNYLKVLDGVKSDGAGGYVKNDISIMYDGNTYWRNAVINRASEILIQDASWFKLRNVNLTYNLASGIVKRMKLDSMSLSVSGSNFLIWTPYRGFDPEGTQYGSGSNVYGFTGKSVPLTQSYSLGLNIGF